MKAIVFVLALLIGGTSVANEEENMKKLQEKFHNSCVIAVKSYQLPPEVTALHYTKCMAAHYDMASNQLKKRFEMEEF